MLHPESISIHNAVIVDTTNDPNWTFPLHSHDHHLEISLIQSGAGTFYYDGHTYSMKSGDIIVKNAGIIHAEQTNRNAPLRQICLSFSGVNEIEGNPNHLLPPYMSPVLHDDEDFDLLSRMFSYLAAHWLSEEQSCICQHLMQASIELIGNLIMRRQKAYTKKTYDSRASEAIAHVADWLNSNYMLKITLNELAEKFYISPYYLDRKFKACIGYSINQYVIDRRMGEAQRMLIFEDKSIKDIALAVGYSNLQYFYATFKKYTGKSPSVFRTEFR